MRCTFVSFVKFKRLSGEQSLSQYEVLPKGRITDNPFVLKLCISATTAIKVKPWEPVKTCLKGKLSLGATEGSFKVDVTRSIHFFSKHCMLDVGSLLMLSVTLSRVELSEVSLPLVSVFKTKWINKNTSLDEVGVFEECKGFFYYYYVFYW